jgi:two-component system NtrC family response regulator/two-component system response regulator HydG
MSEYHRTEAAKERFTLALMDRSLPKAEKDLIRKVLEETDWNLKKSAELLHIAKGTLYSKMKKYNIYGLI